MAFLAGVASIAALAAGSQQAGAIVDAGPQPPKLLPPAVRRASQASDSQQFWLIGIKPGSTLSPRLQAQKISPNVLRVKAANAAATVNDLGSKVVFSEADVVFRSAAADSIDNWARTMTFAPATDGGQSPPIGMVDDPVNINHPDLSGHITALTTDTTTSSHGTSVASIASGSRGSGDLLGIAPGTKVLVYGIAGENKNCSTISAGITKLVASGAKIINLSLANTEQCYLLYTSIAQAISKGATVVAAAGNEFANGDPVMYPAAYPHVISVAAVDSNRTPGDFSSSGTDVDISAPGVNVPAGLFGPTPLYGTVSGTSFAAPVVSAAAQRILSANPSLKPDQVANMLFATARDAGPAGWDKDTGWGVVDVGAALTEKPPFADQLEINDDIPWVNGTLTKRKKAIWSGSGETSFKGRMDLVEDPGDVYRMMIPAGKRAVITLSKIAGSMPKISLYSSKATKVANKSALVAKGSRATNGTTKIFRTNSSSVARLYYLRVALSPTATPLNSSYQVVVK